MLIGTRYNTPPEDALFVIIMGQSNAAGYDVRARLANTDYNYQGIADGFPTVRAAEPQYVSSGVVPGVEIYFKTNDPADDQSLDDGSWQPLELGVNNCQNSGAWEAVGFDLSLCTKLNEYTGKTIYLIKCAYPGTALTSTITPNNPPGNWNNTNREDFINYYASRALRDFRIANPTLRPKLLAINWWQGEHDAMNAISKATYKTQFASFKTYIETNLRTMFVTDNDALPIWNLVKLHFRVDADEAVINDALTELVAENDGFYLIESANYPRTENLTAQEASPITVGDPNSAGGSDNNHNSYITQLSVGELIFDNIITAGLI